MTTIRKPARGRVSRTGRYDDRGLLGALLVENPRVLPSASVSGGFNKLYGLVEVPLRQSLGDLNDNLAVACCSPRIDGRKRK